jgi:hypothetical protein
VGTHIDASVGVVIAKANYRQVTRTTTPISDDFRVSISILDGSVAGVVVSLIPKLTVDRPLTHSMDEGGTILLRIFNAVGAILNGVGHVEPPGRDG